MNKRRRSWVEQQLAETDGVYVMASDYVKALPESIARWFPKKPVTLGTDGFGRSESRPILRRFFEVDAAHVVLASLEALARRGDIDREIAARAVGELGLDAEAPDPLRA